MKSVDGGEKAIRFGCGFLVGVISGGLLATRLFYANGYALLGATAPLAAILGLAAMRFGDRFWHSMKHWLSWLS